MQSLLTQAATAGLAGTLVVYAAALVGALVHYVILSRRTQVSMSPAGLLAFLVPSQLLWSRWTRGDCIIFLLNRFVLALAMPTAATVIALIATGLRKALALTGLTPAGIPQSPLWVILFLGCGLLLRDFVSFYTHLLQHRVEVLWEFHKVHHAPESLIPPTAHRIHPMEQLTNLLSESFMLGLLVGVFGWLTAVTQTELILYSVGLYMIANAVTLSPLRHSHIDLRLGRLEWLLVSPAYHQLHHSSEPEHRNKNFGALFPVWDRLWGTHATPPSTPYRMGLSGGQSAAYAGVWDAYSRPMVRVARLARRRLGSR